MLESSFEKFKEVDAICNEWYEHAKEYAEQIIAIDTLNRYSAEEKINMIARRISNHKEYTEGCAICAKGVK